MRTGSGEFCGKFLCQHLVERFVSSHSVSTLVYMLVRVTSTRLHDNTVGLGLSVDFNILGQFFFSSSKDTKTVHCNSFIKHALGWTKKCVDWTKLPGNSKIRRKSADSPYSRKKIDIRNALADGARSFSGISTRCRPGKLIFWVAPCKYLTSHLKKAKTGPPLSRRSTGLHSEDEQKWLHLNSRLRWTSMRED